MQITCNTSSAYYVQHIVIHATWYKGTAQLLMLTDFKSHLLSFILLAEPGGEETGVPRKNKKNKNKTTSFRKYHVLKPEDSSPKRDSNPHNSIGGRLGKQTCYTTRHKNREKQNKMERRGLLGTYAVCFTTGQLLIKTFLTWYRKMYNK